MRPSSLPKAALLVSTLLLLGTSCSLFRVQNEVGIKLVTVDLTFGGDEPTEFPTPPPPPDLGGFNEPPVIPELPPDDTEPPKDPPPPLCPPTTAIAARDPAVSSIELDNQPDQGSYLFRFFGNYENQEPYFNIGSKSIENVQQTETGFTFVLNDLTFTHSKWTFESRPISVDDPSNAQDGLFLVRLELPETTDTLQPRLLTFEPAAPLKLVDFPMQSGATLNASAIDVAPKSTTPINDPLTGAPILSPSGNAIASSMTIGSPERFEVCEELGHGWKVNWQLDITGEYNVKILGAFWLATQYGGWPIREDYVVSGDLMAGNFATSLMKLDPGDYL